jgi:hypothetical protein
VQVGIFAKQRIANEKAELDNMKAGMREQAIMVERLRAQGTSEEKIAAFVEGMTWRR